MQTVLPAASVASEMVTAGHLLVAREVKAWMSWNCKPHSTSGTDAQRNQYEPADWRKMRLSRVCSLPGTSPWPWALGRHVPRVRRPQVPQGAAAAAPAGVQCKARAYFSIACHCSLTILVFFRFSSVPFLSPKLVYFEPLHHFFGFFCFWRKTNAPAGRASRS